MNLIQKVKEFYINEISDYQLYTFLSEKTKDPDLKNSLSKIANMEKSHASFWKMVLENRNEKIPAANLSEIKKKVSLILAKFTNPIFIASFLEVFEASGIKEYYQFLKTDFLDEKEKKILKKIIIDEISHETFFAKKAEDLGLSNIRDFVLGMNDGLVEILGAVTGLSAVYINNPFMVAISGSIVGIAGALSMGIGAYISVRSQRQINESQNKRIEILFEVSPDKALDELKSHFEELNIPEDIINNILKKIDDKSKIAKLLTKEVKENELKSGLFTGFAYLIGVLFPVLPYFFASSSLMALPFSILFAGIALATVGFFIAVFSGIDYKKKIFEMIAVGFSAAGLSYLFGKIMQTIFGIEI